MVDCISRRRFIQGAGLGAAALLAARTAHAQEKEQSYIAGTYTASAAGRKSVVTVEVTFGPDAIESVEVKGSGETERIAQPAIDQIPERIVELQSLNVDTVTGSTFTSLAILNAVADCVEQAGGNADALWNGPTSPEKTPREVEISCDLVVLGAGISGMGAALRAAQKGADVVVLEKASSMGGNALVSGGFIEYANAPMELRTEMNDGYKTIFDQTLQTCRDAGVDPAVIGKVQQQWDSYYADGETKLFCSNEYLALQILALEGNTYDFQLDYANKLDKATVWLDDMDFPWAPLMAIAGYSWPYFSKPSDAPNGEGYFNFFEEKMTSSPLQVLYATPATELIVENGRVTGAVGICNDGTTYRVHAKDGVVIATGGYADNRDMLAEHDHMWNWNDIPVFHCDNNYGHTGDGIRLAQAVGAAFDELPFNQMIFPFVDTTIFATETTVGYASESLYLNQDGVRFVNEAGSRTEMTTALMEQKDSVAYQICDQDSAGVEGDCTVNGMNVEWAIEQGILYRADTLEELADQIGIDRATFVDSVNSYNKMCETYEDPEFGRSSFGPNAKIDAAPYYASPRTWAMHITMDGLAVDEQCCVLDKDRKAIPGLYCVGEAACGGRGNGSIGGGYAVAEMLYA